jgi:DeoR/GlpR family transcriptional regulator of sugar metabolism
MFLEERHQKILQLLQQQGKVVVKDLSQIFAVTEGMIRKDLQALEKSGQLKRTYGGAITLREINHDEVLSSRLDKNREAKAIIAKLVHKLIPANCSVFLDSSSTNIMIAQELAKQNQFNRVISNMPLLASAFSAESLSEIFIIGGRVDKRLGGIVGLEAVNSLAKYQIDLAVIGVAGIDLTKGIVTNFDSEEGLTKHAAINAAKTTIVTLEKEKFSHDGGFSFASLKDIDILVCDQALSRSEITKLSSYGVEVITP